MKIAINSCFGGFSLSALAVKRGREIAANPTWGGFTLPGERYGDGTLNTMEFNSYHSYDLLRTDPTLIQVIEELGRKANGRCANLEVIDLPPGTRYRITEYDGSEGIELADQIKWEIAA